MPPLLLDLAAAWASARCAWFGQVIDSQSRRVLGSYRPTVLSTRPSNTTPSLYRVVYRYCYRVRVRLGQNQTTAIAPAPAGILAVLSLLVIVGLAAGVYQEVKLRKAPENGAASLVQAVPARQAGIRQGFSLPGSMTRTLFIARGGRVSLNLHIMRILLIGDCTKEGDSECYGQSSRWRSRD